MPSGTTRTGSMTSATPGISPSPTTSTTRTRSAATSALEGTRTGTGTPTRPASRRSARSEEPRAGAGASTTSAPSRPARRRRIRRPLGSLVSATPRCTRTSSASRISTTLYGDPLSGTTLAVANERQGDWVVGIATHDPQSRAYRLKLSTGAIDDIGWAGSSFAYSVNAAGDAVGWGYTDAGETIQAAWVLSQRTGFAKLNDLIDPASGWDLRTAISIDDFGDVVGWGYHNGECLRLPPPHPRAFIGHGRPDGRRGTHLRLRRPAHVDDDARRARRTRARRSGSRRTTASTTAFASTTSGSGTASSRR